MKLLDSWSESELHNEGEIDIGTLLNINQGATNLLNIDTKSCDFETPVALIQILLKEEAKYLLKKGNCCCGCCCCGERFWWDEWW